ncbi:hypothetical protein [Oceanibacterium hippocampi]|uniref:hypothetical protein n=1 Tax=Oceanibacterium hippocampi TaxID=745714 RepID=UPI00111C6DCA|nr:hypothetical protein [Oceanibacterium hippocampi]
MKAHQEALRQAIEELRIKVVPTIVVGSTRIEGFPEPWQIREIVNVVQKRVPFSGHVLRKVTD